MRGVILLVVVFFCGHLLAQYNNDFLFYIRNGKSINLNAEYDINSSVITNQFINQFYFGGKITEKLKKEVSSSLKADNRLGGNMSVNIVGYWGSAKNKKYRYMAGLKHNEFFNSSFSDDFFNLTFFGNKPYLGKTANLSSTNINYFRFQEAKIGIIWDHIDTMAKMGIALSYLKGQSMYRFISRNASIHTAEDASSLEFNMKGELWLSDTGRGKADAFNGNGLTAEFFAEMPYTSKLGHSKFFLSVNNLGFIHWNKNTVHYKADTVFVFSGVNVTNLFEISDSTLNVISKDSIVGNYTESLREKTSINLPTSLFILHQINFTSMFALNTGFRYIFNANYKPYYFFEGEFKLNRSFNSLVHLGYGGYGKLNLGVSLSASFAKTWNIRLGSNSIQGIIKSSGTLGQGAYFSLTKRF